MSIYVSNLWLSDLDEIIEYLPEIEELGGKKVLVTGSTGLICSAVIDVLVRWNLYHDNKITIVAAGRNEKKIAERFSPFDKEKWFDVLQYNATSTDNIMPKSCDYIIHGASNASPNKISAEPVETMLSNFLGVKYLLDYAKENSIKKMLFISSSEVYGKKEGNEPFKSDEYGYIDILNSRNSYSIGKRAAETLCISYAVEYGVELVIARPGHIYGPTALASDNRVSSAWAYDVAFGKEIVMKSAGEQVRSYCYCLDCASAIIKILLKGNSNQAYNIAMPNSVISIRKMAEILSKIGNVDLRLELPTVEEKKAFNPMKNSTIDCTDLLLLGWKARFDVDRGLAHTVDILKEKGFT